MKRREKRKKKRKFGKKKKHKTKRGECKAIRSRKQNDVSKFEKHENESSSFFKNEKQKVEFVSIVPLHAKQTKKNMAHRSCRQKTQKRKGKRETKKKRSQKQKRRGFAKNSRFRRCGVRSKKEKRKTNFSFFGRKSHTRRVFSLGRAGGMLSFLFFFVFFCLTKTKNEKMKKKAQAANKTNVHRQRVVLFETRKTPRKTCQKTLKIGFS
jgi:hypothetical protein